MSGGRAALPLIDPDPSGAGDTVQAAGGRGMPKIAAYAALTSLVLPLTSLISGPLLARSLGPEGRGEVAAVMAPIFVLSFIANMGLPEATTYGIARLRVSVRRVLNRVGLLSVLYGVVAGAGLWLFAPTLLRESPDAVPLLRYVVWALPLLMLTIVLRFTVNGMRRFQMANAERVINPLLRMAFFVVLTVMGTLTVRTAVTSQVLATVLGGLFLLGVALRAPKQPPAATDPEHLTRELAKYGFRGWPGVFGNLVNWRLDQLVLVALTNPVQLGYYAVAVHFSELPSTAMNTLRNVLFAESAHRNSLELVSRAVRAAVLLCVTCAVGGILLSPIVVRVLFGADFSPAVGLAQVLLVASVPFGVEQLLAAGLLAQGHPGKRSLGQVGAAGLTVGGLILLAPPLGAMGAALTSLIAYTVNFVITLLVFRRVSGLTLRAILLPTPSDVRWLSRRLRSMVGKGGRRGGGGGAAVLDDDGPDAPTPPLATVGRPDGPTSDASTPPPEHDPRPRGGHA